MRKQTQTTCPKCGSALLHGDKHFCMKDKPFVVWLSPHIHIEYMLRPGVTFRTKLESEDGKANGSN